MPHTSTPIQSLEILPATAERWDDLQALFGPRGASSGCWCMWWRLKRSDFALQRGEANRLALKGILDSGEVPGLLAYMNGTPAGWCSVAPRQSFLALDSSPTLKRVDDQPVWSVVCFFIARPYRRQGLTVALLKAAVEYAGQHGAGIVEGYPREPVQESIQDASAFTGLASAFRDAGFVEVLRRSAGRPILRYYLK